VSITVGFDPFLVDGYRLIGYDNKRDLLADTALRLQGSTVSSAHSMTALFELVPRYDSLGIEKIGNVKIRYCLPGKREVRVASYEFPNSLIPFDRADPWLKKAACIALFGMKLKASGYAGATGWADLEKMAKRVFAGNNFTDKEFINMVTRARYVYEHQTNP
jgi:Ca-activated chloride channel family protein